MLLHQKVLFTKEEIQKINAIKKKRRPSKKEVVDENHTNGDIGELGE